MAFQCLGYFPCGVSDSFVYQPDPTQYGQNTPFPLAFTLTEMMAFFWTYKELTFAGSVSIIAACATPPPPCCTGSAAWSVTGDDGSGATKMSDLICDTSRGWDVDYLPVSGAARCFFQISSGIPTYTSIPLNTKTDFETATYYPPAYVDLQINSCGFDATSFNDPTALLTPIVCTVFGKTLNLYVRLGPWGYDSYSGTVTITVASTLADS